jgi:hypothetical protein
VLTTEASKQLEERLRNVITVETMHQRELFDTQFKMLEMRTAEQKKDTKDALDAALAAQKEAVAAQTAASEKSITKSETATIERIKAVETLLATSTKASDDKIDDLKVRIVAMEAIKLGATEQATGIRGNLAVTVSVIMAFIGVASLIITIIVVLRP